jgi:hypothetical protein
MAGQGNPNELNVTKKDTFNIVYLVAKGHCACFWPFFRKNFGSEALGIPGLTAFILQFVVWSFWQIPEMPVFIGVWLFAILCHRAATTQAIKQGVIRHTRYEGDVDTTRIKNPAQVKLMLEPLACVVFGIFAEYIGMSHQFAMFIGTGAFSLAAVALLDRMLDQKRLDAMRDAAIEQQYLAARYRGDIE